MPTDEYPLAKMYQYEDGKLIGSIQKAIEKFEYANGYKPTVVVVRDEDFHPSISPKIGIPVGRSPVATPRHFYLYPFVSTRTPVIFEMERTPIL